MCNVWPQRIEPKQLNKFGGLDDVLCTSQFDYEICATITGFSMKASNNTMTHAMSASDNRT